MDKKIIVSQVGSRHRYLIPKIFNDLGLLNLLLTDSSKLSNLGRCAKFLNRFIKNHKVRKLLNREIDNSIPHSLVKSKDSLFFKEIKFNLLKSLKISSNYKNYHDVKLDGIAKDYFKYLKLSNGENILYNMFIENISLVRKAKNMGYKIYSDIYEPLDRYDLMTEKIEQFDFLKSYNNYKIYYNELLETRKRYIPEMIELSDLFIAPSEFVNSTIKNSTNKKSIVIPYGSSIKKNKLNLTCNKNTILWAGKDPIMKGLVNLVLSVKNIKSKKIKIRAAGITDPLVVNDPFFKDVTFLGYLGKEQMIYEYKNAEIFVFPTYSEGLAGVIIEAASFNTPIITTVQSGINPNTFPGIILNDPDDIDELSHKIEILLSNEDLKNDISVKMSKYASEFDLLNYSKRLKSLINELHI